MFVCFFCICLFFVLFCFGFVFVCFVLFCFVFVFGGFCCCLFCFVFCRGPAAVQVDALPLGHVGAQYKEEPACVEKVMIPFAVLRQGTALLA